VASCVALSAIAGAQASPTSSTDRLIRARHGLITAVGPLTTAVTGVSGLREIFGAPTSVRPSDNACRVRFRRHRITVTLANFGLGDACSQGAVQIATVDGRRWRTQRELHVGDSRRRMVRLYPNARFRSGKWELLHAQLFGSRGPTLLAIVRRHRVRKLEAFMGGAGD